MDVGGDTDFQIEIPVDGTIHFDWGYQATDISDFDRGGFVVNGAFTVLALNDSQVPFFSESRSVEVSTGDLFALRVNTSDGQFGAGQLGVTNFVFERNVCGDDATTVGWLSAAPDSGSIAADGSQSVTIAVDATGLGEGAYEGYVCITTNDPDAATVPIEIALVVTEELLDPPRIQVQPMELSASVVEGEATDLAFEMANTGGADLLWQLDESDARCTLPAWLEVVPGQGALSGDQTASVMVAIDAADLESGVYTAPLCLSSNDPDNERIELLIGVVVMDRSTLPDPIFQDRFR